MASSCLLCHIGHFLTNLQNYFDFYCKLEVLLEQSEELLALPSCNRHCGVVSKEQMVVAGLSFQRNQATIKLMPRLLPHFIHGMALGSLSERSYAWRRREMGCPWCLVQHTLGMSQPEFPT